MTKELRFLVNADVHRQFKTLASSQGLSLRSAVLEALELWISAKSKS